MILSRTGTRTTRPHPTGPKRLAAPRIRLGVIAGLALAAGIATTVGAASGAGPFGGLRPHATHQIVRSASARVPIDPATLFPTPVAQVVQKTVDVYDLPATHGQPQSDLAATSSSTSRPSTSPSFPVPTINFPAGPMSAIEATCEAAKLAAEGEPEAYKQAIERQCEAAKQAYEHSHP